MKKILPYIYNADDRGLFRGISQDSWIREINYVETSMGQTRGNHYHAETQEMFFIIEGKIRVTLYNIKTDTEEEQVFEGGDIFIIYPYEVHTFYVLENTKWINMLSKPVKNDDSDFHKFNAPPTEGIL